MAVEVLSGPERRRRWSLEEKAAIVAEAILPGARVSEIARRHGISRGHLYTWRREAGHAIRKDGAALRLPKLVPVMIAGGAEAPKPPAVPAEQAGVAARNVGTIEIALPGGGRGRSGPTLAMIGRGADRRRPWSPIFTRPIAKPSGRPLISRFPRDAAGRRLCRLSRLAETGQVQLAFC